jgi:hypothetical protein
VAVLMIIHENLQNMHRIYRVFLIGEVKATSTALYQIFNLGPSCKQLVTYLLFVKMGAAASAIAIALNTSDKEESKSKEQLELMMKLADARLDTFQAKLNTMFLDRECTMKTSVPGNRALRFERHVKVDTETAVHTSLT